MSDRYKIKKQCWAKSHECSGNLTKEHVVSNSILKYFGALHFTKNEKTYKLGAGSYVISNLCEYHNELLSSYDSEAFKLFSGWHGLLSKKTNSFTPHPSQTDQRIINIDGNLVERWFAKTFYNSILFQTRVFKPKHTPYYPSPKSIIPQLFRGEDFSPPFGLYLIRPDTPLSEKRNMWSMSPQFNKVEHFHSEMKKWETYELPTIYYTTCGGMELVGFFNLTQYEDDFALEHLLKPIKEQLESTGIYRKIKFGVTLEGDTGCDDDRGPHRMIDLMW
jgi:hypothetical protein